LHVVLNEILNDAVIICVHNCGDGCGAASVGYDGRARSRHLSIRGKCHCLLQGKPEIIEQELVLGKLLVNNIVDLHRDYDGIAHIHGCRGRGCRGYTYSGCRDFHDDIKVTSCHVVKSVHPLQSLAQQLWYLLRIVKDLGFHILQVQVAVRQDVH